MAPARLIFAAPEPREPLPVAGRLVFGRTAENDVCLPHPHVSKRHAVLEPADDGWILRDLGSHNGTLVNGARVALVRLAEGDEIEIGPFRMRLSSAREPEAESPVTVVQADANVEASLDHVEAGFRPAASLGPDELQRGYEKLRVAHELSLALGLERDPNRVLEHILSYCCEALPAEHGAVLTHEPDGTWRVRAVRRREQRFAIPRAVLSRVEQTGQALLVDEGGRSLLAVPVVAGGVPRAVLLLDDERRGAFGLQDLQLLSGIAAQAALALERADLARRIEEEAETRAYLARFLSPALVEQVRTGALDLSRSSRTDVTVLFADIRGFTPYAEAVGPEETVRMLNAYFDVVADSVFRFGGVLDKFIGDAVMALWGAPVARPDDAERAVGCGLDMLVRLQMLNRVRARVGDAPVRVGIGIHAGEAVVGCIGSSRRLEFTAIGDTVNLASRLCGLAGPDEILVTASTATALHSRFRITELPPVGIKGKSQTIAVGRVDGVAEQMPVGSR